MSTISFEAFGRKLDRAASQVKQSEAAITLAGARGLATEVATGYRRATGGDGRLSGTGNARRGTGKAAAVSARAKDVRRYSDGTYVSIVVPTGPYGLIERNIAPHVITPFAFSQRQQRSTLRKARKKAYAGDTSALLATRVARAAMAARTSKALRVPGSPRGYVASVNHPGTRGRNVFSASVARSGGKVGKQMLAETTKQLVAGYRTGK